MARGFARVCPSVPAAYCKPVMPGGADEADCRALLARRVFRRGEEAMFKIAVAILGERREIDERRCRDALIPIPTDLAAELNVGRQLSAPTHQQPIARPIAGLIEAALKIFGQRRLLDGDEKLQNQRVIARVGRNYLRSLPELGQACCVWLA